MPYYPVFLDLKGKLCVVLGGGRVAERKITSLIKVEAKVKVISPALTKKLSSLKAKGQIKHLPRDYRRGNLKGAFLAISATDSEETNVKAAEEARRLNIPINVVDKPALCSFIVPSVLKRGPLLIAISTSGVSPALARSIRLELEKIYGKEFEAYLKKLSRVRERAIKKLAPEERRKLFKRLGSDDIIRAVREGKVPEGFPD
jgi:precorrin-2 dehydrogenase/sirohydrochlorin ferrochelatase